MEKQHCIFFACIIQVMSLGAACAQDVRLCADTISSDSLYINITNTSNDTLYLFDRYFEYADDVHLHRYTTHPRRYYLSFVPLTDCIGWQPHRRWGNLLVCRGGLDYHFTALNPRCCQRISLPITSLQSHTYYKDFDARSTFYYGSKFKKKKTIAAREITIVFAVYKDVENMNRNWIQENGVNEDPILCKRAYDYVIAYETYYLTLDL